MANIVVPELGESVVEARVARWLKREGEHVNAGETVVELETEKIDLEVNADRAGVLTSIKHQTGEDVKIGEILAVLDEAGAASTDGPPAVAPAASKERKAEAVADEALRATPAARRMARAHALDIDAVPGSGPGGRVMKGDVQNIIAAPGGGLPVPPPQKAPAQPAAAAAPAPAPAHAREASQEAPAAPVTARPRAATGGRRETRTRMTKRRETIARRLVEAQRTAAMLTTFNEVDMSGLMSLRERQKQAFKDRHGVNLGIASFFVKASIAALRAFPQLNAEIQGDEIVLKHYYDLGMAVGAEGGLVVPVIRDADTLSFADIELAIRDFARRAGEGSLTLDDLMGGTFTITNGGVFGSLLSTPILNPPQVGILGLHKIEDRAVPLNGQVVIRPMMYVALSYDHRIVDGREAVQFLVKVKALIEDPGTMLLES